MIWKWNYPPALVDAYRQLFIGGINQDRSAMNAAAIAIGYFQADIRERQRQAVLDIFSPGLRTATPRRLLRFRDLGSRRPCSRRRACPRPGQGFLAHPARRRAVSPSQAWRNVPACSKPEDKGGYATAGRWPSRVACQVPAMASSCWIVHGAWITRKNHALRSHDKSELAA